MELDSYQEEAKRYLIEVPADFNRLDYLVLGLCGEAGEVAEKYKRTLRGENVLRADFLAELGDVLWYLAALASCLDTQLSEVANGNLDKLQDRNARGKLKGTGDNR